MDAILLSIGAELAEGHTVDTNAAWLATRLTAVGVSVVGHVTVGDDVTRIEQAIRDARERADLLIATGGLGPTPDDLTREAVAKALDADLETSDEALQQIKERFERWGRPVSPSNLGQALIPRGCQVIANYHGTAPGIRHQGNNSQLFFLPGVPSEMRGMFEEMVAPLIQSVAGAARIHTTQLCCFGINEAKLGELLADMMRPGMNPAIGTSAADAVIAVRIVARGADGAEALRLASEAKDEITRRLGEAVFGEGDATLQEAVAGLLVKRGLTVATAESCTGGWVAKRLTDVAGASGYFLRGYVTYANEAKTVLLGVPEGLIDKEGAVSEAVAGAMATGCREASGADLAVSVTGIAGPAGGSEAKPVGLVFIGLAHTDGVLVRRVQIGGYLSRHDIRDRSSKAALNLLRLHLLGALPG